MNYNDPDRHQKIIVSRCKTLQNHIVECLKDSEESFHYEEMMSAFKMLHPELSGWVLQTTLEQWKQESEEYSLDLD